MAVVAQTNQEDEQTQNGQQPTTGGGGQVLNSGGAGASPTGGGAAPAASTPQQSTPSGRPNIQQYMNANQGAGQQLAGGIQRNVQSQYNQFNQNYNQTQDTLNQQYNPISEGLGSGQQTANTAFQKPEDLLNAYQQSQQQQSQQQQQQAMQSNGSQPAANTSNTADQSQQQQPAANPSLDAYNQFQKLNSGGYSTDINNYQTAAQSALGTLQPQQQNLQQQADASKNEMGRFQLLRQAIGQPNYSSGQQTLDAAFLQGQPGVANQLQQNIGNVANQANQQVTGATTNVTNQIADLNQKSGDTQQYIKNLFGGGLNDINTAVNKQYTDLQTNLPAQQKAYADAIKNNQFNPDQLAALGLSTGQRTWGLTADQIAQAGGLTNNKLLAADQGGLAQAANADQFARYNALNQLGGGAAGSMQANMFGTAQQAGGFNPISFNAGNLQNAVDQRQQAVLGSDFQNSINQTAQALRGLSHGGYTNGQANGFAAQISQAKTPQEAEGLIQKYIQTLHGEGLNNAIGDYSSLNPFQTYYNSEFTPSATSVVGQNYGQQAQVNNGAQYTWDAQGHPVWNAYTGGSAPSGAAANLIGSAAAAPGQNNLPVDVNGQIDWSQIAAPKGK